MPSQKKSLISTSDGGIEIDNIDSIVELEQLSLSQRMEQRLRSIKANLLRKKPRLALLAQKIPLLTGFLRAVSQGGSALSGLATLDVDVIGPMKASASGFQAAGLALHIIDFFRIPLIYLSFIIAGEKPPISLSKNARWLYSAVMVALASIAIALPFTAPPIAIAIAAITLVFSIAVLMKTIHRRNLLRAQLALAEEEIAKETAILNALRSKVIGIEVELSTTSKDSHTIAAQLADLSAEFDQRLEKLQRLHDEKLQHEVGLKKRGFTKLMDRSVGIALVATALVGLVLSLFFPMVGLIIFGISAAAGITYATTRLFTIIKGALNQAKQNDADESMLFSNEENDPLLNNAPSHQSVLGLLEAHRTVLENSQNSTISSAVSTLIPSTVTSSHHPLPKDCIREMGLFSTSRYSELTPNSTSPADPLRGKEEDHRPHPAHNMNSSFED